MGACGCGDFEGFARFPGPDNTHYVLQIYGSCSHCDNPAGIVIYKFTKEECRDWGADELPLVNVDFCGFGIPVIHPQKMKEHIARLLIRDDAIGDEIDADIIADEAMHGFRDVVHSSTDEYLSNIRLMTGWSAGKKWRRSMRTNAMTSEDERGEVRGDYPPPWRPYTNRPGDDRLLHIGQINRPPPCASFRNMPHTDPRRTDNEPTGRGLGKAVTITICVCLAFAIASALGVFG